MRGDKASRPELRHHPLPERGRSAVEALKWLAPPALVFFAAAMLRLNSHINFPASLDARIPNLKHGMEIAESSILWLAGAWLLSRALEIFFWQAVVRPLLGRSVPKLLQQTLLILVYGVAITGIIAFVLGQSVAVIWQTSGVITIVLGLALRGIIGDIFTGLAFNFDQGFRIGDWIELTDKNYPHLFGQIREIHWRATRIHTVDGREIVVPNNTLGSMIVTNFSAPDDVCRFELPLTLDVRVPFERVLRILEAATLSACRTGKVVENPSPDVLVSGPNNNGIEYTIRYWIRVGETTPSVGRNIVAQAALRHLSIAGLAPVDSVKNDVIFLPAAVTLPLQKDPQARLIEGVEMFQALTEAEILHLTEIMRPRRLAARENIVREGDGGNSLFIIAEGVVEVTVRRADKSVRLAVLEAGEFFGEMSLLTGEPRSATVTALGEILLYEITNADFAVILSARSELFESLSRLAAERRLGHAGHKTGGLIEPADDVTSGLSQQILARMSAFFRQLGQKKSA